MKIIIKDTNEPSVDTVTQKTIMDEKEIDIGSSEYLINRTSAWCRLIYVCLSKHSMKSIHCWN